MQFVNFVKIFRCGKYSRNQAKNHTLGLLLQLAQKSLLPEAQFICQGRIRKC